MEKYLTLWPSAVAFRGNSDNNSQTVTQKRKYL